MGECVAQPVQGLTEGITGLVLSDAAPEEVDNFVASDFPAYGEQGEQRERFAPAESGRNATRAVSERWWSEEPEVVDGGVWNRRNLRFVNNL